ncbi:tetratricopeptide repeat protein [Umezawaea tangerina]|uniref:Tetratricopeptide repeat protein n=1 Tax=Umezawaea tangerina TaxID=84725 RepID=A0A2T0T2I7_9PSEU|nr:tetratricopeptide repeat protein [Umezawaea tangerina]PRY39898.1 tetratricopeptide repeat protein [Umezawaea tangerina]
MDVTLLYRKALRQADFGRLDAAESTLREVLAVAERGSAARVRALVVLGDLLCELGRAAEAVPLLDEALAGAPDVDDLLDHELDRARALRRGHGG